MTRAMLATALLAATASWAAADEVLLKGGGRIVGEVLDRNPREVTIDVGPGTVKLLMTSVDRIVVSSSRLSEFRSRAFRLNPDDVQGWLALADWADQNDLLTQAREAWEHVLAVQADNQVAQQALGNVWHAGRWMERSDAMRARGLVEFNGVWMSLGERESRLRMQAAWAGADRETAIADARVAEAEARAREAEARAHAAELDAERIAEYSDDIIDDYWPPVPVTVDPIVPVQPCCERGHHPDHGGRPRFDPPIPPSPQPAPAPRSNSSHASLRPKR